MSVLRNVTADIELASSVRRATSALERAVGLLRVGTLAPTEGLWLRGCAAIHTLGMRTAIDVVFLDRNDRVVELRPGVVPNTVCVWASRARTIVEMGPGFLVAAHIALGDQLELIELTTAAKRGRSIECRVPELR